jgi:uncharacterized protein YxjI
MRYLVRERLFDFKEDFWVTDERGDRVFYARSKLVSLHHTLVLEDARGHKLASIKHKLLTFLDSMNIEHDGRVVATVHRAVFSPLHHRSIIELHDEGTKLEAVGNIIDKDFEIRYGRHAVARISRKWFRLRDTYGVDVAPGQNDALMIAIAICLDRIHHDEQERHGLSGRFAAQELDVAGGGGLDHLAGARAQDGLPPAAVYPVEGVRAYRRDDVADSRFR